MLNMKKNLKSVVSKNAGKTAVCVCFYLTQAPTATGTHTHRQGKGRDLMNQIRGIKMWLNVSNN